MPAGAAMYVRGVIWMFAVLPLFPASLRAGAATQRASEGDAPRGSQFSAAPEVPATATRLKRAERSYHVIHIAQGVLM